ncbi:calcium:proton antiporter [Muricoccus pecuniae]|uniref:Ca2+:H+ antiporter n=1 Tax=Muricoccus pecuniae TaxID=693023 RepID=A0A840YJK5_9PROT|nr:ionic transporter y4hA [Roseomonas pecuniae]MBB5694194.1 Ca2+:H+ antiporter [Roseomonas pecuniae]
MSSIHHHPLRWDGWVPSVLGLIGAVAVGLSATGWVALPVFALLLLAVRAAVHHAETVAARVGEPFGTLVLALAVTVIEVALVASVMVTADPPKPTLVRDTIHAVVMLVAAGLTGLCIVLAALRHREPGFNADGATALLSVVAAMGTLVLVLPNHVRAAPGGEYAPVQVAVVAGLCLALWLVFVLVQTVLHRTYFVPADDRALIEGTGEALEALDIRPSGREAGLAGGLLLLALVAVVLLAKTVAPAIGQTVAAAGLPVSVEGVIVAAIVLMPETATALRAAMADRLQASLNLALGSAIATIGLSVPILAGLAAWLGQPLDLGIPPADTVLLVLTFVTGMLALSGRITNLLQGCVLLVVFAAWLLVVLVP